VYSITKMKYSVSFRINCSNARESYGSPMCSRAHIANRHSRCVFALLNEFVYTCLGDNMRRTVAFSSLSSRKSHRCLPSRSTRSGHVEKIFYTTKLIQRSPTSRGITLFFTFLINVLYATNLDRNPSILSLNLETIS